MTSHRTKVLMTAVMTDPSLAAYFGIVALCLVLFGVALTGPLTNEQRATLIGSTFVALAYVAWRARTRRPPFDGGDP